MNVLVIGSKGFIGTELCRVLSDRGYKVFSGVRKKTLINEIEIPLDGIVEIPTSSRPDIVIDVSNKYIPAESEEAINAMSNTILGVSRTIIRSNDLWQVPILQTTSYLQYCPEEEQPWNRYSALRNESLRALQISAKQAGRTLLEFVLHDTYGEYPRNKFLDLCIEAIKNGNPIAAGEGKSFINLTHINDICNFIADQISSESSRLNENLRWDIKSSDTYTLQSLVQLLEEISGQTPIVRWGTLDNPRREVLEMWDIPNSITNFKNKTNLVNWLPTKISKGA
jgi:nucleoside-diphosphate-sugar epimerase